MINEYFASKVRSCNSRNEVDCFLVHCHSNLHSTNIYYEKNCSYLTTIIKFEEKFQFMIKVSCAIIVESGKVLCVQRSQKMSHPLKWEFPGGKIEEGETSVQSLKREIFEELNLEVEITEKLKTYDYTYDKELKVRLFPFICKIISGKIRVVEHRDFIWLEPDKMNKIDFLEADRVIIEDLILKGI